MAWWSSVGAVTARRVAVGLGVLVVVLLGAAQLAALVTDDEPGPGRHLSLLQQGVAGVPASLDLQAPRAERTVEAYAGYGAWVDVYDFAQAFQGPGHPPPLTPDSVDDMADQGVRTLYLQAAQLDLRSPELLVEPAVLGQFLVRAHQEGMQVVAWYLPRFTDLDRDLAHLRAIAEFEVLGHRFDGVAVDIEWTEGVPDHAARSAALVELSERLRAATGDDALGAIVLPPLQIEVVNPNKWPGFPWQELAEVYDVWLPMGYWTQRDPATGFHDGDAYTRQNVQRLREILGDPSAPVHFIGGLAADLTPEHVTGFAEALADTDAIGGSMYDWASLQPGIAAQVADDLS
jgi:hypothetical protein